MTINELVKACNNEITSYYLTISTITATKPIQQCDKRNFRINLNRLLEEYGDRTVAKFDINKKTMIIEINTIRKPLSKKQIQIINNRLEGVEALLEFPENLVSSAKKKEYLAERKIMLKTLKDGYYDY